MKQNKVILWTTSYAELLNGNSIGGIGVQMMFWAKIFAQNGWIVYSLYDKEKPIIDSSICHFKKDTETHAWNFYIYIFSCFRILLSVRPNLVICRGGKNRNLLFIALCCKIFKIKLIHFFASDVDLDQNKFTSRKSDIYNIRLFRYGLKLITHFVVQNEYQKDQVIKQFNNKHVLLIPNIWGGKASFNNSGEREIILWVGNTRKLKRPQWFFDIAKYFPNKKFVLIGGNADQEVYNECVELAKVNPNAEILGAQPFNTTNEWFAKAKVLICTSEYEGFPNTFLQAWSNGIPVISTVDPNNIIRNYNLGYICKSPAEFVTALTKLYKPKEYEHLHHNVITYFTNSHSLQSNFDKLIHFVKG